MLILESYEETKLDLQQMFIVYGKSALLFLSLAKLLVMLACPLSFSPALLFMSLFSLHYM